MSKEQQLLNGLREKVMSLYFEANIHPEKVIQELVILGALSLESYGHDYCEVEREDQLIVMKILDKDDLDD